MKPTPDELIKEADVHAKMTGEMERLARPAVTGVIGWALDADVT